MSGIRALPATTITRLFDSYKQAVLRCADLLVQTGTGDAAAVKESVRSAYSGFLQAADGFIPLEQQNLLRASGFSAAGDRCHILGDYLYAGMVNHAHHPKAMLEFAGGITPYYGYGAKSAEGKGLLNLTKSFAPAFEAAQSAMAEGATAGLSWFDAARGELSQKWGVALHPYKPKAIPELAEETAKLAEKASKFAKDGLVFKHVVAVGLCAAVAGAIGYGLGSRMSDRQR